METSNQNILYMPFTQEDRQELRQMIQDAMNLNTARTESQFEIINNKLDGINNHLTQLNGKVVKQEKAIGDLMIDMIKEKEAHKIENIEHQVNCPIKPKLDELDKRMVSHDAVKKWVVSSISITAIVISVLITILEFVIKM